MQIKLLSLASLTCLFAIASGSPAPYDQSNTNAVAPSQTDPNAVATDPAADFQTKVDQILANPEVQATLSFLVGQIAAQLDNPTAFTPKPQ
ncbi:MAG: hypothetical protein EXX96DRAFT_585332 [Benjaminiella poitrasii]|nr:MAG: hypothetical protein EXX96DRAFT_585332 [Benjaminiella poitrasii]